jgi:hypothetical protein
VPQPYYASQPGQAGQQGSAVPQPYYASQQGFGAPGGMPPQGFSQQPMMVAPQQMMVRAGPPALSAAAGRKRPPLRLPAPLQCVR